MSADWMNDIDEYGETPLTRAARSGRSELTNIMVLCDLEETLGEVVKAPPLHRAAYWDSAEAVRDLVGEGHDVSVTDERGETPLHKAVRLGNMEAARALVEADANLDLQDTVMGMTPLHWAVLGGRVDLVELLVSHGANVTAQEWMAGGLTALDMARSLDYSEVIEALHRQQALCSGFY